ncbi:CO dehydrogenase flavoprotein-like, FAD-binding, subdomain 2 [Acididesulfobacillus acetoxydans]|uniref:CO dehydrogenase flavoprotein-like, FAD-binding, subdomain 2 n=1 Tax=Acididesulfobacillus acetoxydans TaxID=1561005 RepID=A0A8S0VVH4_9FIRM|nr:FAD-binding oxidoreductase [Acididesulfobacillus acetoxydans]CAA7599483.1 CO dehydrogenase flavoprotein-like, FAD-binding, subdomain 2 [Acididesulfobacillus acetoxydans]CEJ09288.1 Glycolate oxidase subunit GlcD [Acididesulfobacillus acetoxydans]
MSNETVNRIKGLVGEGNVVDSPSAMARYLKGQGRPLAVAMPGNTAEVAEIVKLANEEGLKIAVGGRVVESRGLDGGLALVMSRMNQVLEIDHANLTATVQPGLAHTEFSRILAEQNLVFPPEPNVPKTGSVGGCFALGEADSQAFQYMPVRTYLLGYEMVLPNGDILEVGNKCIKNVSGYDLIHFAVGSRGTLGIFTRLLVKLLPPPAVKMALVADFASLPKACQAMATLIRRRIFPTRLNLLNPALAAGIDPGSKGNLVMVDLTGFKNSTELLAEEIAGIFHLAGSSEVQAVKEAEGYAKLWQGWLDLRGELNTTWAERVIDFNVGPMKLAAALQALTEITGDLGAYPGLVAEGLLGRVRLLLPAAGEREEMAVKVNALAMSFGGNVSGNFGSKLVCRAYNDAEMWEGIESLLGQIRRQFDPKGILAPGVSL